MDSGSESSTAGAAPIEVCFSVLICVKNDECGNFIRSGGSLVVGVELFCSRTVAKLLKMGVNTKITS